MAFTPIDEQTWERREYLEVFRQTAIYLTAEVDITPLYRHTKARGEKLYPALVWCVAAVLNRHAHFRYGRDEAGRIGIWDELHPYYTVPRRDAPDLFAMKVTALCRTMIVFRQDFSGGLCPGGDLRPAALRRDPAPKCLRYLRHAGAGLLRLQLRRGPQAGLSHPSSCWGRSTGRGPDGAAGGRGVLPTPSTTAATSAVFFKELEETAAKLFSGLKEKETARGDACPCGRSSI